MRCTLTDSDNRIKWNPIYAPQLLARRICGEDLVRAVSSLARCHGP